jgi:hypothetical protein
MWPEMLTMTPPGTVCLVPDFANLVGTRLILNIPDLEMHCDTESCSGIRFFDGGADVTLLTSGDQNIFLEYRCRNCKKSPKLFAVKNVLSRPDRHIVLKIGEWPPYGPVTPGGVIAIVGPDRDFFLKGRRAENLGLGIGAFAYYRRVVENQKGRLIREISKVARTLGAGQPVLDRFEAAAKETQFSKAIDDIKDVMPESLRIQGHNPLSLLHSALSKGLHAQADDECLAIATSIRVVLTELAERITQALKDEAELRNAVNQLLNPST